LRPPSASLANIPNVGMGGPERGGEGKKKKRKSNVPKSLSNVATPTLCNFLLF